MVSLLELSRFFLKTSHARIGGANRTRPAAVFQDSRLLERHEPFRDHLVENRDESVDPLLAVHDLDDHGQIFRETEDVRGVENAPRAEARNAVKDGGAREAFLPK